MARTKSMKELFQPLKIKFFLDAPRPYFEVDGARTYLLTEDGEISQNALFSLQHGLAEYKKYEQFKKMRDFLVDTIHEGTPVQEGDLPAEAGTKKTHANVHAKVLREFVSTIFDGDEAKVKEVMKTAVEARTKKTIIINGTSV